MSQILIDQLRKQRELKIPVGKFKFFARRPTDVEAKSLRDDRADNSDMAMRFVTGWEIVTEDDIVGGGGTTPVPFDAALWREWCADRPDFWSPIAMEILKAYKAHAEHIESIAKN